MTTATMTKPTTTKSTGDFFAAARIAGFDPIPLNDWDATRDGRKVGKAPRDAGWPTKDYRNFDAAAHLRSGGNVGLRPRPGRVVLDVDPRNGGDRGLYALEMYFPEIEKAPRTRTGSGGFHIFLSVPEDLALSPVLRGYGGGIEIKGSHHQVVAPGSRHPDNGEQYVTEIPFSGPPPMAPEGLLSLMTLPPRQPSAPAEAGVMSAAQLEKALGFLDPIKFGEYESFFRLICAAHHATAGDPEAMGVFLDWAAGDPKYADADAENETMWDSLSLDRDSGVTTYKTLLDHISATGPKGRAFVASFDRATAAEDFDGEPIDPGWRVDDDAGEPATGEGKKPRYTILSLSEIFALPEPTFLVADFIPDESVTMVFGAPKVGKTFAVIDLACHVALGRSFHGHTTKKGRVLYVASEGGARVFGARVKAWQTEHGVATADLVESLHVIEDSVALNDPKAVATFLRDIRGAGDFALIVFDTLLANNSGDVNSNEDMSALMRSAHEIRRKSGGNVLLVHHSGRAIGSREMGAQALGAGVDAIMSLTRQDKSDVRVLRLEKSRNSEEGETIGLMLKPSAESAVMVRSDVFASRDPKKAWEFILCRVVSEGSAFVRDFIAPGGRTSRLFAKGSVHRAVAYLREEGLLKPKVGGERDSEEPLKATSLGALEALSFGVSPPTEGLEDDDEFDGY